MWAPGYLCISLLVSGPYQLKHPIVLYNQLGWGTLLDTAWLDHNNTGMMGGPIAQKVQGLNEQNADALGKSIVETVFFVQQIRI